MNIVTNESRKFFAAYLAGVIDSDGSLSISINHRIRKTPNYTALFQLTWTKTTLSLDFMDRLVRTYGGSYCFVTPSNSQYKNSRNCIKYVLTGDKLKTLLEEVYPFLVLKRRQAKNILWLRKTIGQYGNGRLKPKRLQDFHTFLYKFNQTLNTKNGVPHDDCN